MAWIYLFLAGGVRDHLGGGPENVWICIHKGRRVHRRDDDPQLRVAGAGDERTTAGNELRNLDGHRRRGDSDLGNVAAERAADWPRIACIGLIIIGIIGLKVLAPATAHPSG